VFDLNNLRRAYRWLLSNPDPAYKAYFRDAYDAFALASDTHLRWIRQEGLSERYQVSHASKVLLPKPSGSLRSITLLTVEDQIVYQACVNLIAEALKRRTAPRYEKTIFAHLYGGKTSSFFYKRWQTGYKKFGEKIRTAHSNGFTHIADFDLASFYDSIDHNVLRHFLIDIKVDEDTITFLLDCLKIWTSTTWSNGPKNIYHGHGIPQGPMSSGMLSETVLLHLDAAGEKGKNTVYLRYVDDVKILAKSEEELRRKLVKLDITAKEVGLFPQTAKINIRAILDPNDEIKSVSRPPEPALKPLVNQDKLIPRIISMIRSGRVTPLQATRYKYLIANAIPTSRLNAKLLTVLANQPEFAPSITSYFARYKKIPAKTASAILAMLKEPELYHSVSANLLDACVENMHPLWIPQFGQYAADRLVRPPKGALPLQPTFKAALIGWGLTARTLTFAEIQALMRDETDWWVKMRSIRSLTTDTFGPPSYGHLINSFLREQVGEAANVAATRMLQDKVSLTKPYGDVAEGAKRTLKAAGIIRVNGRPPSRINEITAYIFKRHKTAYRWDTFFAKGHRQAEIMMIFLKRNRETNIDAFLVQLDSFCDLLTGVIWSRLKPGKGYPNFGHAIKDATLITALPNMMACLLILHDLRLQSTTAHPRQKAGTPTRRLKHRDFQKLRPKLVAAWDEFESVIVP
jgi:Reverse transcriptase (RNA-dependent DNA polymerase)